MLGKRKGQSTLEYALIIVAVVVALVALQRYLQRSIQGRVRASSDQIGNQFDVKTGKSIRTVGGGEAHADATLRTITHESRDTQQKSDGGITTNVVAAERIETNESDTWGPLQ